MIEISYNTVYIEQLLEDAGISEQQRNDILLEVKKEIKISAEEYGDEKWQEGANDGWEDKSPIDFEETELIEALEYSEMLIVAKNLYEREKLIILKRYYEKYSLKELQSILL